VMHKDAMSTCTLNETGLREDPLFRNQEIVSGSLPDPATYRALAAMGYDPLVEKTFTSDHAELVQWTNFFGERLNQRGIFRYFLGSGFQPSFAAATVVGPQWLRFSSSMPRLLCQAAVKVSTNECRHYVIQTAFEELGMRREDEIHCNLFRDCVRAAGVMETESDRVDPVLDRLYDNLRRSRSQSFILGLLLGLEMPATENIETVFRSLAHNADVANRMAGTLFFRLHRLIEAEHVRLTISNFLRFCQTDAHKRQFIRGFDAGISFWSDFWRQAEELIQPT
jgi:hypothetical protein